MTVSPPLFGDLSLNEHSLLAPSVLSKLEVRSLMLRCIISVSAAGEVIGLFDPRWILISTRGEVSEDLQARVQYSGTHTVSA